MFRRAGARDVQAVQDLTQAAYAPWVAVMGRRPLPMDTDFAVAVRDHLIDLWEEGALLGLIEMVPMPDHLLVENVAVRPGYQGQGLGHRLMARAEAVARDLGLPQIRLYTNAALTINLAFYAGLGFAETGRAPFRGGTLVHFAKPVGR